MLFQENLAKNLEGLQIGTPHHSALPIKFATVSATQTMSSEHQTNILQGRYRLDASNETWVLFTLEML